MQFYRKSADKIINANAGMEKIAGFLQSLKNPWAGGLLAIAGSLTALLPVSPLVMSFASRDSGVFLYMGWRILHGEMPYVDVWDHKPLLIYFLDALGIFLTPHSLWGVWLIEWSFLAIAAWAGYRLLSQLFGNFVPWQVSLLWLVSFTITVAGGNLTTEYSLPFQFLMLYVFWLNCKKPAVWHFGLIGILGGLAFMTRQNSLAIIAALALFLAIHHAVRREWRSLARVYAEMFAGFSVPVLLALAYLSRVSGGIASFWDAAFVYNFAYSTERTWGDRIYAVQYGFEWLGQTGLAYLALAGWLLCILWLLRKPAITASVRQFLWFALLAFPLEIFFVSISGRPRIPYYLTLLPIFSVFSGFLLWFVALRLQKNLGDKACLWLGLALLVGSALLLAGKYVDVVRSNHLTLDTNKAVAYVLANSAPDDTVLMWGAETAINFFAQRRSPSRFVYQYPLYRADYAGVALYQEFLSNILQKKPKLIILTTGGGKIPRSFGSTSEVTDQMIEQIRNLYSNKVRLGEWVVFTRSDLSP